MTKQAFCCKCGKWHFRNIEHQCEADRLRFALSQWKCPGCGGSGMYERDKKGRASKLARGLEPDPHYQPGPEMCKVCRGDGLHPIASAALRGDEQ